MYIPFNKLQYTYPWTKPTDKHIQKVIGFDTEADRQGIPFVFSFSDGFSCTLKDIPQCFFRRAYRGCHLVVYNLKYDSGNILHNMPIRKLQKLIKSNACEHQGYRYKYIPHKLLRISQGRNAINIWDIASFYTNSLEITSNTFLGKSKKDLDPTLFTNKYISDNIEKISEYCVQDASLTQELGMFLLKTLSTIGVMPNNLYSTASVSFEYFKNHTKIITSWRYWKEFREILEAAYNSYAGGKFETTARGRFDGYMYDINSAYPYEMRNLLDITNAYAWRSKKYEKDSDYGFLKVHIDNGSLEFHPVPVTLGYLNTYPLGRYTADITKEEYIYLKERGVDVGIITGYWIKVGKKQYPYRKIIDALYDQKLKFKGVDKMKYMLTKIILNSFYGKMIQRIEQEDGTYKVGAGFNPIYASIITARTRIRISEMQHIMQDNCIAVHTDSVNTLKPIPASYLSDDMGSFYGTDKQPGVMIMSGVYQHGTHQAYRGFKVKKGFQWMHHLQEQGFRQEIEMEQQIVPSWIYAIKSKSWKDKNVFTKVLKSISLNRDYKRNWLTKTNAHKLLEGLEYSLPRIEVLI